MAAGKGTLLMHETINTHAIMAATQGEQFMIEQSAFDRGMAAIRVLGKPMTHTPRTIQQIVGGMHEQSMFSSIENASHEPFSRFGNTAIISIDAPIFYTASIFNIIFGGLANSSIVYALNAASEDETIKRIALDFHCPGGECFGMSNLVEAIESANERKPVISLVHDMSASAALWMMCKTKRIVATPSSMMGSIGTITVLMDESEAYAKAGVKPVVVTDSPHKAKGRPGVPITEEMITKEREYITGLSSDFRAAVTAKTGITDEEITEMGGSVHCAKDALARGLCDEIRGSADFYNALDAGEYDQYGPGQSNAKTTGETPVPPKNNTTSGRAVAQQMNGATAMADKEIDDKIAAMSDEEKDTELARLMGDEESPTDDEEETTEASTDEDEETSASTEDDEDASAATEDEDPKASASVMTFKTARAVLAPHAKNISKASMTTLVSNAVEKNQSQTQVLSACIAEMGSPGNQHRAELEANASGTHKPVGGGAGAQRGGGNGSGGAKAQFEAAVKAQMDSVSGMSKSQAFTAVAIAQPKLAEAYEIEASAR